MKKILIISFISILFLTGCNIGNEMEKLGKDVSTSYDKAAKETKETIQDVKDAKAKVEETVKDLEEAKNKIKEASASISEVVK